MVGGSASLYCALGGTTFEPVFKDVIGRYRSVLSFTPTSYARSRSKVKSGDGISFLHDFDRFMGCVNDAVFDMLRFAVHAELLLFWGKLTAVIPLELQPDTPAVNPDPEIGRA
jgi:hypothetical protein